MRRRPARAPGRAGPKARSARARALALAVTARARWLEGAFGSVFGREEEEGKVNETVFSGGEDFYSLSYM